MKNVKSNIACCLILVFSVITGCDKKDAQDDNSTPPTQVPDCRVIQAERANFPTHTFHYDGQKRLVGHSFSTYVNTISYNGNTILNEQTSNGNPFYKNIITVNAQGFATNVKTEYPNGTWTNDAYQYDGDRLIKKTRTKNGSVSTSHTTYQWLDGNMIGETAPDGKMTTYSFNTNEPFQLGDYLGFVELEQGFKTVRNSNRVTGIKSSGITYAISYVEDDKGLIKSYNVSASPNVNYTVNIQHNCN